MTTIRAARPDDLERLVPLFAALARHYQQTQLAPDLLRRRIVAGLFEAIPRARLLLAEASGQGQGFLTWNTSFPGPDMGCRLVIEDLFVLPALRGLGIGQALLRAAALQARDLGAAELSWLTEAANLDAQRFYQRLGARHHDEKRVYRVATAELLKD